jgi:hypothetical protein
MQAKQFILKSADIRDGELRAVLWSFAYFFCLLCGYYVLRPIRDEMGIQVGVGNLAWLFTATFIAMLAIVPVFGWVSSRFPRRRFLPYAYLFFVANLVLFFVLFHEKVALEGTRKAFFVWVSVFNLFVVSVFWSFMADLYDTAQARRPLWIHRRRWQRRRDRRSGSDDRTRPAARPGQSAAGVGGVPDRCHRVHSTTLKRADRAAFVPGCDRGSPRRRRLVRWHQARARVALSADDLRLRRAV